MTSFSERGNLAVHVLAILTVGLVSSSQAYGAGGDVVFDFASVAGGTEIDVGRALAVDTFGNVYSTGVFQGTADFDPGMGTFNLTSEGDFDIFVQKLDSAGNLLWAKSMGGPQQDSGRDIAVDASGNVYSTGEFRGTVDFDPGAGTFNLTGVGPTNRTPLLLNGFVSKLDSDGNFVWAKTMSGNLHLRGLSIAVDASSGNVYTAGAFSGTADFDPGMDTFNLTSVAVTDNFVQKLDSAGNLLWAKSMGSISFSADRGGRVQIALDTLGNAYTTGFFQATADFDPGAGTFNLTSVSPVNMFVSKLDSDGNFVWAKAMTGTSAVQGWDIAVDASSGNVYTTGFFNGTIDFDPGAGTANFTSAGSADLFVSKLDTAGNFEWTKTVGGPSGDQSFAIALDASGGVYTTGIFHTTVDFDPGSGTANLTAVLSNGFVSKLDSEGNFVWAKATGAGSSNGVAVDASGNVYTTGNFVGTADFDPGAGTFNITSAGSNDIFVLKLSVDNSAPTALAGGDVSIHWTQQDLTTILGQGFDAEGDDLTYSWTDVTGGGSVVLLPSTPTGLAGEADLDLSLLPFFPIGPSTLELEVSDGLETTSDEMVLTLTNLAPTANAGGNLMILSSEQESTVLLGVASDADTEGEDLSYRWLDVTGGGSTELLPFTPAGPSGEAPLELGTLAPLSLGAHDLVLEVTDGVESASNSERTMVLTIGNSPPTPVLTGAGTKDFGDPIPIGGFVSDFDGDLIDWEIVEEADVLAFGQVLAQFEGAPTLIPDTDLSSVLGLGIHLLTLNVNDGTNLDASNTGTVTVKDNDDPTLAPIASASLLWPPNHKLVPVTIFVNAGDNSGDPINLSVSIVSDEPVDGTGDGNTEPDIIIDGVIDGPGGFIDLQLRSERKGTGDGRTYTITIVAEDSSGNSSMAQVQVIAPHDKGKN